MSNVFLALVYMHIVGAGVVGLALIYTLFLLTKKYQKHYKSTAITLSALTSFQLITGSVMSLLHPMTIQRFCVNISIYLAIIVVAEYCLLIQSKKTNYNFPLIPVVSLFLFGITGVLFSFFQLYI